MLSNRPSVVHKATHLTQLTTSPIAGTLGKRWPTNRLPYSVNSYSTFIPIFVGTEVCLCPIWVDNTLHGVSSAIIAVGRLVEKKGTVVGFGTGEKGNWHTQARIQKTIEISSCYSCREGRGPGTATIVQGETINCTVGGGWIRGWHHWIHILPVFIDDTNQTIFPPCNHYLS